MKHRGLVDEENRSIPRTPFVALSGGSPFPRLSMAELQRNPNTGVRIWSRHNQKAEGKAHKYSTVATHHERARRVAAF